MAKLKFTLGKVLKEPQDQHQIRLLSLEVPIDLSLEVPIDLSLEVPIDLSLEVPTSTDMGSWTHAEVSG